jgi:hypothetical protein
MLVPLRDQMKEREEIVEAVVLQSAVMLWRWDKKIVLARFDPNS